LDSPTTDKSKRAELLAYAALTGAYLATWKGYYHIVPRMLATASKMTQACAGATQGLAGAMLGNAAAVQAGLPTAALIAQLSANIGACTMLYNIASRSIDPPGDGILIFIYLFSITFLFFQVCRICAHFSYLFIFSLIRQDIPLELKATAQSYAQHFAQHPNASDQPLNANLIIVAGSNLPARVRATSESIITKRPILGPEVVLDDLSVLSLSEALMWAQVNPFSPTCSGKNLNPY
jgi:hypothetical protein